ncbi:hypothetical protein VPH35_134331 [Triticum aestivum]
MAMVLEAFASYIADTIKQMAADEVGMLLDITGEIDSLQDKLEILRDYLADADRKRITDRRVQGWVTKLKGVMYEGTNILDLCELNAMGRRDVAPASYYNPLLFCLRHPRFAHDIGSRIRKLNKRLDDICKLGAAFSFIKLETYQDYRTGRPSAADRKTDPVLERSASSETRPKVHTFTSASSLNNNSITGSYKLSLNMQQRVTPKSLIAENKRRDCCRVRNHLKVILSDRSIQEFILE